MCMRTGAICGGSLTTCWATVPNMPWRGPASIWSWSGEGQVTLSIKNISRDPLNVPPERLMERFVRGRVPDHRGSGLGLSIARSLTELQGGTFELAVDGDLFKATVTMPQSG